MVSETRYESLKAEIGRKVFLQIRYLLESVITNAHHIQSETTSVSPLVKVHESCESAERDLRTVTVVSLCMRLFEFNKN